MKRLLGIIDLLGGVWLILLFFNLVGIKGVVFLGILIGAKGFFLKTTWISWIDFAVGIYMVLIFVEPRSFLNFVGAIWLLQKGIYSMF